MIITERKLRTIIRMQLIQEAFIDRLLQKVDNPRHREDLLYASNAGLSNSTLQWLLKVFRENTDPDGDHHYEPMEDMVPTLRSFEKNKSSIAARARARELYDPDHDPESFYSADINTFEYVHAIRDMLNHLEHQQRSKKEKEDIKRAQTAYVYKGPNFNVVMPKTVESSCFWGLDTKWCTAATKSQNLFLSYVARGDANIVLYYIIKKGTNPRTDPYAKMSVGYVDGVPILKGQDGGVSVNVENKGLTEQKLLSVLGSEYEPIWRAMKTHAAKIGGKHPAKKQMEAAAKDIKLFKKYTRGMGKDELYGFLETMVDHYGEHLDHNTQDEIFSYILSQWPNRPNNAYMMLNLQDVSQNIVRHVLNSDFKVWHGLAIRKAKDDVIAEFIARGDIDLVGPPANMEDISLRQAIARNKSTPWPVIRKMIDNGLERYYPGDTTLLIVLDTVMTRNDVPPDLVANVLETYKDSPMEYAAALKHPNLPKDIFDKVAKDVLQNPHRKPKTGSHTTSYLMSVLESANLSNNALGDIIRQSYGHEARNWILGTVLKNPNISTENIELVWKIWENLYRKGGGKLPSNTNNIIATIIYHHNTPDRILQKIVDINPGGSNAWYAEAAQEVLDGTRQRHPAGHVYNVW